MTLLLIYAKQVFAMQMLQIHRYVAAPPESLQSNATL
jgi:hypothetical protein